MDKIIVEVFIPATGSTHDFEIPVENTVAHVAMEMADILHEVAGEAVLDLQQVQLCDLDRHTLLPDDATLLEACVHDGSRLMLV